MSYAICYVWSRAQLRLVLLYYVPICIAALYVSTYYYQQLYTDLYNSSFLPIIIFVKFCTSKLSDAICYVWSRAQLRLVLLYCVPICIAALYACSCEYTHAHTDLYNSSFLPIIIFVKVLILILFLIKTFLNLEYKDVSIDY